MLLNISKCITHYYFCQDVSHNDLSTLPLGVGFLTALTKLDASHNRLADVPPELTGLMGMLMKLTVEF